MAAGMTAIADVSALYCCLIMAMQTSALAIECRLAAVDHELRFLRSPAAAPELQRPEREHQIPSYRA
jgi:hypothetical protein